MGAQTPTETQDSSRSGGSLLETAVRFLFGLPLAGVGGLLTVILVLLSCGEVVTRVGGGLPIGGLSGFVFFWCFFGAVPLGIGLLLLNLVPRVLTSGKFMLGVALFLAVVVIDAEFGPNNWHAPFRRAKFFSGNASELRSTYVSPHLDVVIRPGTNLVWCGTFQLAWNAACQHAGGDLELRGGAGATQTGINPMASALNRHTFTADSIDEASSVVIAGTVKEHIDRKIKTAMAQKFSGAFAPRLLPEKYTTGRPQDLVAYACLYKKLSFAAPFERLEDSFHFGTSQVRAFGIGRTRAAHDAMYPQVRILDYRGPTNFVIELKTTTPGDRLILARVQPNGTLAELVGAVRERIANRSGEEARTNDILIVPRIALDLLREYTELENSRLLPAGRSVAPDLILRSALQSIKFELNEKGVELRSEAHLAFGCAQEPRPPQEHLLIFDEPFLLMLEHQGAPMPYFALWLDNPELMVKW